MRLVAAVDVHDGGEAMVEQAVPWAKRFHGRLDLLYASEWSTEGLPEPPNRTDELDALWADWKRLANEERTSLAELQAKIPEDVRGSERFVSGRPIDALPDAAESYDLLMFSTHARRGLERVLLGSVTQRLLREVETPVLVVGRGDAVCDPTGRMLVLVPMDESDDGALSWVQNHLGADRIELVHVLPPERWLPATLLGAPGLPADPAERSAAIEADLRARASSHGFPVAPIHIVRRETSNAGDAIAELAQRLKADVIVMPTHGRKGLERLFVGSVAERVVERAPCPVIVVPRPSLER